MKGEDAALFEFSNDAQTPMEQVSLRTTPTPGMTYSYAPESAYRVTIKVDDGTTGDAIAVTIYPEQPHRVRIEPIEYRASASPPSPKS